ncbi:MAG: Rieske (2Fe-2S) protein [Flavobacteriales bacterium]|nr:Rieske (2Fe-2S) protein [Flavobacteriales bacterium]
MDRKDFIVNCGKACLGGMLITGFLSSCVNQYYAKVRFESNRIVVPLNEFYILKNGEKKSRKFVLARIEKLSFPVCIFKLGENEYSALYMECSHNSCELNPNGDYLICPCHGSEFDRKGKVQNPPAEKDLFRFKVTSDEENIYVQVA